MFSLEADKWINIMNITQQAMAYSKEKIESYQGIC